MMFKPSGQSLAFPINCECPCHDSGDVCLSCMTVACDGFRSLNALENEIQA